MYSRDEVKQIKQLFWTKFGQFMVLHPSADGEKVNWVNYKTGIKHLYFRMDADKNEAKIAISWSQPDAGIRALMAEQFMQFKAVLHAILGEEWTWEMDSHDEYGRPVCQIYTVLEGHSIFDESEWGTLISFFKSRIIALDEFWSDAKYAFNIFK
ncbi:MULTISPECIES: DUF4268 domain-containing protein [Sphingobacterium]|uniref:DUF4268 domain-containing protein n=1 Tax=Sphingobacterium TaxID=28453 RepID=UPI002242F88C|nr:MULTISPECIES: DUF4268 domain-containing protein [Sphingobacterium]MCW8313347.1 DUF4268 domain-containing protein [Sphingobacterium sp. InxBP1]